MVLLRSPDKTLLAIDSANNKYKIFGYTSPTCSGKLEALKQALDLPATDFHLDFELNIDYIEIWCKHFLTCSLLGPVVKVLKNAELIAGSALTLLRTM
mgnify:CR=1 FL=1